MDPISIALICAAVFGGVFLIAAFIRQIMLSRDKQLNDEAQSRALNQEVRELEKMRSQMQNDTRFDSHYKILGVNKDAIAYIDKKIEEILSKKSALVERYAQVTVKESTSIISGEGSADRKAICDRLRREIDREMIFYDTELKQYQERRKSLWDAHTVFEKLLLGQEKVRNDHLDNVYKQHSSLLEKVYLRHIDDAEVIAVKNVEASTMSFKDLLMAPIQYLMQFFGASPGVGISLVQTRVENASRIQVDKTQEDINDSEPELQNDLKSHEKITSNQDKMTQQADEYKKELSEEPKPEQVETNSSPYFV